MSRAALRAHAERIALAAAKRAGVVGRALWSVHAEILTAAAMLAGWALLTHGVASLVAAYLPRAVPAVWPLSVGALCMCGTGWRLAWTIATSGLYALTRPETGTVRRG